MRVIFTALNMPDRSTTQGSHLTRIVIFDTWIGFLRRVHTTLLTYNNIIHYNSDLADASWFL